MPRPLIELLADARHTTDIYTRVEAELALNARVMGNTERPSPLVVASGLLDAYLDRTADKDKFVADLEQDWIASQLGLLATAEAEASYQDAS